MACGKRLRRKWSLSLRPRGWSTANRRCTIRCSYLRPMPPRAVVRSVRSSTVWGSNWLVHRPRVWDDASTVDDVWTEIHTTKKGQSHVVRRFGRDHAAANAAGGKPGDRRGHAAAPVEGRRRPPGTRRLIAGRLL